MFSVSRPSELVVLNCEFSVINRLISANDGVQPDAIFSSSRDFRLGGEGPGPRVQILARSTRRTGPPGLRYSLSHFHRRRASWKPIGSRLTEGQSCVSVPFACAIRSSVMAVVANRPTTRIMTGFRSAAAIAIGAKRRSLSLPPFSPPYCHYSLIAWKVTPGKLPLPRSKILIAWRIPPRCADGSAVWIRPGRPFRFCAK